MLKQNEEPIVRSVEKKEDQKESVQPKRDFGLLCVTSYCIHLI